MKKIWKNFFAFFYSYLLIDNLFSSPQSDIYIKFSIIYGIRQIDNVSFKLAKFEDLFGNKKVDSFNKKYK